MTLITLTEVAAKKIKQNLDKRGKGIGIRVGVRTTGCSGMAYVLEYVDQTSDHEGSIVIQADNHINIFTNKKDAVYLEGMTIDYVRQGLNEGFEFVNPNERDRCGCGESFRI